MTEFHRIFQLLPSPFLVKVKQCAEFIIHLLMSRCSEVHEQVDTPQRPCCQSSWDTQSEKDGLKMPSLTFCEMCLLDRGSTLWVCLLLCRHLDINLCSQHKIEIAQIQRDYIMKYNPKGSCELKCAIQKQNNMLSAMLKLIQLFILIEQDLLWKSKS